MDWRNDDDDDNRHLFRFQAQEGIVFLHINLGSETTGSLNAITLGRIHVYVMCDNEARIW